MTVTGVQTCALPIYYESVKDIASEMEISETKVTTVLARLRNELKEIGRASCRERV